MVAPLHNYLGLETEASRYLTAGFFIVGLCIRINLNQSFPYITKIGGRIKEEIFLIVSISYPAFKNIEFYFFGNRFRQLTVG